ncbi:von Willebrand factor, type A [Cynara cardunculus var. scolymus]|uniref:von Willebrand factor, type A n=1 Tax=Cynara cardunculus var. scolymus TaxID=59895 RepID=A0A103YB59_CYNCS|nr:von Willebrand factor, type A [Cynara cardunculus var. scolymus]
MAVDEFSRSVQMGIQLSRRICYGKDKASMTAPKQPSMKKSLSSSSSASSLRSPQSHRPSAPMVYAVIVDPSTVDNPDICSYQPYVYGRCDPPALVPLHMHGIAMEVECYLDTAFVSVTGTWRVHCVSSSACCDCRIAIPMGEQGSVLGIEVETTRRSYSTKFVTSQDLEKVTTIKNGFLMKGNTYTFKIFQVEGGSYVHVNVRWSQKLTYQDREFCLSIPFTFPAHVVPVVKGTPNKEKVSLNVISGMETEIMCAQMISLLHFKKEVVFLVDISESMHDAPLEKTKDAVIGCLSELNHGDYFNIIAFNGDIQPFSSSLELATEEGITNATEWITNLIAEGGTNLLLPLKQAFDMVGKTGESIPLIFLITDGAVEDEKDICNTMKDRLLDGGINCPRICTFGIDSISEQLPKLLKNALSPVLANITLDALQNLDSHELYPFRIPDLFGSPVIVSGRYEGNFPDIVKARGFMADMSTYVIDVKVCARREVDSLTAHAWLDTNQQLEEKVAKMSLQMGVHCEYTSMILVQGDRVKPPIDSVLPEENLSIGFGNLMASVDGVPPGIEEVEEKEPAGMMMQAASSVWGIFLDRCCCMCFIQCCSRMNDQCAIVMAQLCTALACLECLNCCCEVCDSCSDLCS